MTCHINLLKLNLYVQSGAKDKQPWMEDEVKALVSYLRFRGYDKDWAVGKIDDLWKEAPNFITNCVTSSKERSGKIIHHSVLYTSIYTMICSSENNKYLNFQENIIIDLVLEYNLSAAFAITLMYSF